MRKGDWKRVRQSERGAPPPSFQPFNLENDIGEAVDMLKKRPKIANDYQHERNPRNGKLGVAKHGASNIQNLSSGMMVLTQPVHFGFATLDGMF